MENENFVPSEDDVRRGIRSAKKMDAEIKAEGTPFVVLDGGGSDPNFVPTEEEIEEAMDNAKLIEEEM